MAVSLLPTVYLESQHDANCVTDPPHQCYPVSAFNKMPRRYERAQLTCNSIVEDARKPMAYRMLLPMVDVIFADVAQPDQARIVGINAKLFLKQGGGLLISIKASCIDSTAPPEQVFASEVQKLREDKFFPKEQLTLGKFAACCSVCGMAY